MNRLYQKAEAKKSETRTGTQDLWYVGPSLNHWISLFFRFNIPKLFKYIYIFFIKRNINI